MSAVNLTDTTESFDFIISPEPRRTTVDVSKGNYVEIAFVVRNVSGRTVRAEALINPLPDASELANPALPPGPWAQYLHILNPDEWEFEHGAVRTYVTRLELPDLFPSGSYSFQLLIVGTDDPDNQVVESDPVTFTVSGPALNVRPYLLATIAILAIIILLGVGAALFLKPKAQLTVQFSPPKEMEAGKLATYNVIVADARQESLKNVVLDFTLPNGLMNVSAFVPNSPLRNCDKNLSNLHCDLGDMQPGASVTITFEALAGPVGGAIKYANSMTVSSLLNGKRSVQVVVPQQDITTVKPASQDVSVAIVPAQSVALTGETLRYNLLTWSNSALTDPFKITYTLPQGLTYLEPLPSNCTQQTDPSDYFTLICTGKFTGKAGEVQSIAIQAVASAPNRKLVHHATLQYLDSSSTPTDEVKEFKSDDVTTSAVSTALMFNGADDWVELGFDKGLPTFTAEMWVHPFSTDDGQAFIGAHRQASTNVDNMFLVGYYNDGLSVEINGEYHNLEWTKVADRFHLAVVVQKLQADTWQAIVYINGVPQPWRDPEDTGVCRAAGSSTDNCKLFKDPTSETLMDGSPTMPWVLGQDWDQGLRGPKTSDFFYGSLAEVSLWNTVRSQDQIQAEMNQRPHGDEAGLVGYWRLEPGDLTSTALADRASGQYPGTRINANWNDITPRYGTALKFNGANDALSVNNLHFSNLKVGADGNVELTMAGWFYVDGIPTRQQWLIGNVGNTPSSGQFMGTIPPPNSSDSRNPLTCALLPAAEAPTGTTTTSSPDIWAGLMLTDDGHIAVVARSEGTKWTIYKDERSIPVGRWVHFAGVIVFNVASNQVNCMALIRNGSWIPSLNIQQNEVDQIRVDTVGAVDTATCDHHFYIGGLCSGYNFIGKIDDVRIWNRVVQPSEIDVWSKLPGIAFDEVAYWPFDDILGGVRPNGCNLAQACDRSLDGSYNLDVSGPEWVPADPNLLPVAPSR